MSVHAWLTAENAQSELHATLQRLYAGARSVLRNPLGVAGRIVICRLVLTAALAPVLATYPP